MALVWVLADEERIRGEPCKGRFEDKVDKTPKDTLLAFLFRGQS